MKKQKQFLTLLLLISAWLGASTTQGATAGTVLAWGDTGPVPVAAQSGVTAIAAGWAHILALKNDGTVVAWGWNDYGQVTGTPPTNNFPDFATASPVTLGGQVLSGVTAIAAGYDHTVALKTDGSVVAWGDNGYGQVTIPIGAQSGVMAIAAGWHYTLALKTDGSVVAWGDNGYGQVTGTITPFPGPYSAIASPVTLGGQVLSGVTAIAAGASYSYITPWIYLFELNTVALKNDGSVVAWGDNRHGQVTGTPTDGPAFRIASPVMLGGQVLSGVTAIAAGGSHTVALKTGGSVVAWGAGTTRTGVFPDAGQSIVPVTAQSGVAAIAAGDFHTVALKSDGSVVAWGYLDQTTVPAGLSGVTAIAAGRLYTVALVGTALVMPSLIARPSGNELILSWPTNVVGFTLQSTLNLTPPVTWIDSTSAPAIIGGQFTVTKAITGSARFYRLRKP